MPPRTHAGPPCDAPAQIRKNATAHQHHPRKRRERSPSDADPLPLDVPKEYNLQGVKLATLIQSLAYRRIREQRTRTTGSRATAEQYMLMMRQTIAAYDGLQETDEAIWKGIRRRSIHTRVQQFLYKAMHGMQKIGDFWSHIRGYDGSPPTL